MNIVTKSYRLKIDQIPAESETKWSSWIERLTEIIRFDFQARLEVSFPSEYTLAPSSGIPLVLRREPPYDST
jgi:hypothetical protein